LNVRHVIRTGGIKGREGSGGNKGRTARGGQPKRAEHEKRKKMSKTNPCDRQRLLFVIKIWWSASIWLLFPYDRVNSTEYDSQRMHSV
jgi:hypothetical protein